MTPDRPTLADRVRPDTSPTGWIGPVVTILVLLVFIFGIGRRYHG